MSTPLRRTFWRVYALSAVTWIAVLLSGFIGPRLEAYLVPVRGAQRIEQIARTTDRLCFDWVWEKLRDRATDDLDVYLTAENLPGRMVVSLIRAEDGMPWRSTGAVPVGPARKRYCVEIPPGIPPKAGVSLSVTLWYSGWLGLWRVPIPAPVVTAPRVTEPAPG